MVTNRRGRWIVRVSGLPNPVIWPRRDLPESSAIKTLRISRRPTAVYVSVGVRGRGAETQAIARPGGLDRGVVSRITLSDGRRVEETVGGRLADLQQRISW